MRYVSFFLQKVNDPSHIFLVEELKITELPKPFPNEWRLTQIEPWNSASQHWGEIHEANKKDVLDYVYELKVTNDLTDAEIKEYAYCIRHGGSEWYLLKGIE